MLHVALFAIVTVLLFAIVMGPALNAFNPLLTEMFSLMVFALYLRILLVPKLGPPSNAPIALNRPSATVFV